MTLRHGATTSRRPVQQYAWRHWGSTTTLCHILLVFTNYIAWSRARSQILVCVYWSDFDGVFLLGVRTFGVCTLELSTHWSRA
jgi:hypothetical protein